ncbi:MAG: hypothetical protein V2I26_03120 [Halieaceae bacterium]|jgi:hypothetical protein|nr:hypothetical protein [Halieaceae bacterium]
MAIRILRWSAVLLAAILVLSAVQGARLWQAAQQPPQHLERKGRLVEVELLSSYRLHDGEVREYRLFSDSGLIADIAVRHPDQGHAHRPLLLVMGGQETGRAAVDVIPDSHGATVAAISYPFGVVPHRSLAQVFLALPRIQQGIFDTPAAALLALDYLLSPESGINPGRVELAGISFGAYLASVPAVLDPRIERLWLIHGGGAPADVIDHGLEKRISIAPLRRAISEYLAAVAGAVHLGPELWAGSISPRPTVLVHALRESSLPPSAIRALERAVNPPMEILYTPGKHVHPERPEVVKAISDLMLQRLR